MSKHLRKQTTYNLDLFLYGISFEEFLKKTKPSLLCDALEELNGEYANITATFVVEKPSPDAVFESAQRYHRADGQYVLRGKFIPREEVEEIIRAHEKNVILDLYVKE